jgi:DUF1680 family protein
MRLLASLEHYIASTDDTGLQLHQYATGRYTGEVAGTLVAVSVSTDIPWSGTVRVTVEEGPADRPWTLSLRLPSWSAAHTVGLPGEETAALPAKAGWIRLKRVWAPGDEVVLELTLAPRLTKADPRVDAARGCVAIERGPLVYCLEGADHPGGALDDVVIDTDAPLTTDHNPGLLGGVTTVTAVGRRRALPEAGWWPYSDAVLPTTACGPEQPPPAPLELTAIPYYAWANRTDGPMRVWIPTR